MENHSAGQLHHIEFNVSDLLKAEEFWGWFLTKLGYSPYQTWNKGRSWRLGDTYIVFVQTDEQFLDHYYDRRVVGLNHLAFHARDFEQVDALYELLLLRKVTNLRHTKNDAQDVNYAVIFEAPDGILVEVIVRK